MNNRTVLLYLDNEGQILLNSTNRQLEPDQSGQIIHETPNCQNKVR